jgi:dipeptidyl aminopeptidase/acylaminoacyl peptidase
VTDAQSPPTLLLHGRRNEPVWFLQSQRLAARLNEIGARHYFLTLPWATHAFDCNPRGPGSQVANAAIEKFLADVTR